MVPELLMNPGGRLPPIPLAELFNSALEDICDLVSPDYHPLVTQAKDKGSAAVLLAIVANVLILLALWLMG